jgi:uncharacterized lipoprotein YmbA
MPTSLRAPLLLALLLLGGCSLLQPLPDRTRFYVLDSNAAVQDGEVALPADGLSVGLGPVRIPEYLRRPEIVTRTGAAEIEPSLTDRWAEPLDSAVPRVLARELARELATPRVASYPWYRRSSPDVQVSIELLQFECDASNQAVLSARYEVRDLRADGDRLYRATHLSRAASSSSTEAQVEALQGALADFARELAAAVRELSGPAA